MVKQQREQHQTITTFKGVNLTDPSHVIDDREFETVINLVISDTGDLIRRKPLRTFAFNADTNSVNYVLGVFYNRLVWFDVDSRTLSISQVDTTIGTTYATKVLSEEIFQPSVLYNGKIYLFTATLPSLLEITVNPWTADAPAITEAPFSNTNYEDTNQAVIFKDRMFTTKGVTELSSRIYYSEIADPTTSTGGNFFDVRPGDGDYITDMVPFGERLFIFKRFSTWILVPAGLPSSWIVKNFDNSVGAISKNCVLEKRGLLYVLSPRGLYRSDGTVYDYVGYPVEKRFLDRIELFADGHLSLVDDNIFVATNIADLGFWMYNPIQNAWTEQVFPTMTNTILNLGRQGYLTDGKRRTFFGTQSTTVGGNILWFDTKDVDLTTNTEFSDYTFHHVTPASRVITPIHTEFATKMWDQGAFFRQKRHKYSTVEVMIPEQANVLDAEFHTNYEMDNNMSSPDHEFRIDVNNRGNLAHRIPGVGYHRRFQLKWQSDTLVDYMIASYDNAYFSKGTIENPE